MNLLKYLIHYNFKANVHQSCFIAKSIADENTPMSKLGVSYQNMNLFYTIILLWSSSTSLLLLLYSLTYFKFNCLYHIFSATHYIILQCVKIILIQRSFINRVHGKSILVTTA
jgi:hypothetical protein